ncbi:MAG TPA: DUF4388 domain-containing protein, partial [Thermoanaerobaculia bacterium]|nr:DUF4388 domain-containing protein [Thermoanaerobaculia bacterium]
PMAMQVCPVEERELLKTNLIAMRDSRSLRVTPVDLLHREQRPAPAAAPESAVEVVNRSARRLSLIMERLSRQMPQASGAGPAPAMPEPQPLAQLMTMAAASSSSQQELDQYLSSIRPLAGGRETENLFSILADAIPSWDIAVPEGADVPATPAAEAMRKIFTLTPGGIESNGRLRELLTAAVEQFNKGSLSAAVAMFDLADVVAREKSVDPSTYGRMRAAAAESLAPDRMKKYAEDKTKHPLLRKALGGFPTLTTEGLLQQLRGEERPERRRALLGTLEAWGAKSRDAALGELEVELNRPPHEVDTYYLRNLIYLLHRIPRDGDASTDKELELLRLASERGQSIYVIKEAIVPLGQIQSDAAVKVLTMRLAELEATLLRKDTSLYSAGEMQKVLDRIGAALARIGTPAALFTLARHGMKPNPLLGDTRLRMTALSQHDLSFDSQIVELIVKTIREDLPGKLLGRIIPKRQPPPVHLIEALSSTRSETVESLFIEIAEKFADQDVGRVASAALAGVRAGAKRETASPTLTGDLQFFGLPSLLQSLAESQATGIVTLTGQASRQTAGKILFLRGKFVDAQAAQLRGADALYQLLERPVSGSFSFVPQPSEKVQSRTEPVTVMPLLFEGIRRHDELKQASIVAPDELRLKPTGVKPSADAEETDASLVREVWVKASGGVPVGVWEKEIASDSYRIRRMVARWLEEGALQPA